MLLAGAGAVMIAGTTVVMTAETTGNPLFLNVSSYKSVTPTPTRSQERRQTAQQPLPAARRQRCLRRALIRSPPRKRLEGFWS
jgi:hypothetical protein